MLKHRSRTAVWAAGLIRAEGADFHSVTYAANIITKRRVLNTQKLHPSQQIQQQPPEFIAQPIQPFHQGWQVLWASSQTP